jgi:hypothetical protein
MILASTTPASTEAAIHQLIFPNMIENSVVPPEAEVILSCPN